MPKIAMLHSEWNGCAHWRVFEPARFLNKLKGWEIVYFPKTKQLKGNLDYYKKKCEGCDLIVSMRVDNIKSVQMLMVLRHVCKVPLVFETDDDFQNVDHYNISAHHWKFGSEPYTCGTLQQAESDLNQFSTMPLKRKFGYANSWVLPNLIDVEKVGALRQENDTDFIRIGWAGSATHYKDLHGIIPAIDRILAEHKNVKFVPIGMKTDFMHKDYNEHEKVHTLKDRYEYTEGAHFRKWPKLLAAAKLDAVVIPLEDIVFNRSKSNCRYLELSSLKIPGIYGGVTPYSDTINHRKNGYIVNPMEVSARKLSRSTIEKWYEYLKMLVESKDLREEIGGAAHENVKNNYSLQNNLNKWSDAYEEMLKSNVSLHDIGEAERYFEEEGIDLGV